MALIPSHPLKFDDLDIDADTQLDFSHELKTQFKPAFLIPRKASEHKLRKTVVTSMHDNEFVIESYMPRISEDEISL